METLAVVKWHGNFGRGWRLDLERESKEAQEANAWKISRSGQLWDQVPVQQREEG